MEFLITAVCFVSWWYFLKAAFNLLQHLTSVAYIKEEGWSVAMRTGCKSHPYDNNKSSTVQMQIICSECVHLPGAPWKRGAALNGFPS